MSGGLCRELAGKLWKYVGDIDSVCLSADNHPPPMVLHYRDEDVYMKVLSFVGLSRITAHHRQHSPF